MNIAFRLIIYISLQKCVISKTRNLSFLWIATYKLPDDLKTTHIHYDGDPFSKVVLAPKKLLVICGIEDSLGEDSRGKRFICNVLSNFLERRVSSKL